MVWAEGFLDNFGEWTAIYIMENIQLLHSCMNLQVLIQSSFSFSPKFIFPSVFHKSILNFVSRPTESRCPLEKPLIVGPSSLLMQNRFMGHRESYCVLPQVQHPERAPTRSSLQIAYTDSALLLIGSASALVYSSLQQTSADAITDARLLVLHWEAERVSLTGTVLGAHCNACVCLCVTL